MQNVPFTMDHYKLRVVEAPTLKMKQLFQDGKHVGEEPATGPNGEARYETVLYIRAREADQYGNKDSEELKVTLSSPCEDIEEDDVVEMVGARLGTFAFTTEKGKKISGVSVKAESLVKAS